MSNMQGRPLAEAGRAVTSYHPPSGQVTANHNNHPNLPTYNGTLTNTQVTLAIDDLGPGDEGEYACKAENPWGDTTCTLLVGGFSIAPLLKSIFAKIASAYCMLGPDISKKCLLFLLLRNTN